MYQRRLLTRPFFIISCFVLITIITGSTLLLQRTQSAEARSGGYNWKPLKIGGGGYITGLIFHPTDGAIKYARTDVGGGYRWNARTQTWSQLFIEKSVANPLTNDYRVESMALSVSNPRMLLSANGGDEFVSVENGQGRILRSTDGGTTWTASAQRFWMTGNGDGRQGSERLVIDPRSSTTAYFGTRKQGLWKSIDSGVTWTQVPLTTIPAGTDAIGVQFVRVDATGPLVQGKSARVYASVAGQGIYRSDDAGSTWRQILNTTDTGYSVSIAGDQTMYVGFQAGVRKYNPTSDTWTTITPPRNDSGWQVAVSPVDPQFVFASPVGMGGQRFFRSHDGGATWQSISIALSSSAIPWVGATDDVNFFPTAALLFDPARPIRLWLAEGTGVWYSDSINGSTITWQNASRGIEETVTTDVIAPPGGSPITTIYDRQGFYHANPDAYPTKPLIDDQFWGGTSLDYSGGNPNFVVTVQVKNNYYPALTGRGAYSTDAGKTWTLFPSLPAMTVGGNVAVSATDPNNIVWLPSTGDYGQGNGTYYTKDRATTWAQSTGYSSTKTHWLFWWGLKKALESDKVQGGTFYLMTFDNDGTLYVSHDGGATFTQATHSPSCAESDDCHLFGQIHAAPGQAGHLWSSAGRGGLWYTTDGGASEWTHIANVQDARSFGFGKPLPGSQYPAIYLYGKVNGETTTGVWRSGDKGATWTKLANYPAGIYDAINTVSGDMNIAGRVYVGFGGNGFVYGDDPCVQRGK